MGPALTLTLSRRRGDRSREPVRPLVGRDLVRVLERQSDVVQSLKQTLPTRLVHLKREREAVVVRNAARLEIDRQAIARMAAERAKRSSIAASSS